MTEKHQIPEEALSDAVSILATRIYREHQTEWWKGITVSRVIREDETPGLSLTHSDNPKFVLAEASLDGYDNWSRVRSELSGSQGRAIEVFFCKVGELVDEYTIVDNPLRGLHLSRVVNPLAIEAYVREWGTFPLEKGNLDIICAPLLKGGVLSVYSKHSPAAIEGGKDMEMLAHLREDGSYWYRGSEYVKMAMDLALSAVEKARSIAKDIEKLSPRLQGLKLKVVDTPDARELRDYLTLRVSRSGEGVGTVRVHMGHPTFHMLDAIARKFAEPLDLDF